MDSRIVMKLSKNCRRLGLIPLMLFVSAMVSTCTAVEHGKRPGALTAQVSGLAMPACLDSLAAIDQAVSDSETEDAETQRVATFPYLRINRFLAAIGRRPTVQHIESPAFSAWVRHLRALNDKARTVELANLPRPAQLELNRELELIWGEPADALKVAPRCASYLASNDLKDRSRRRLLLDNAHVDDSYSTLQRIVGVYPLTAVPALIGWNAWKAENLSSFAREGNERALKGMVIDYWPDQQASPLPAAEVKEIIAKSRDPNLGIPEPSPASLAPLFSTFAPVWRIDATGNFDRIGYPYWDAESGIPDVDTGRPAVFTRLSHTIVDTEILPQLVYMIWFRQRPPDGSFDLLSGRLDAVIWRVTLGPDGRPLIYDTIHACGCYHLFFPAPSARILPYAHPIDDEGKTIPARAPYVPEGERLVLHIESRTHYLSEIGITAGDRSPANIVPYSFVTDTALQSLPWRGLERRSLYGPDGLVDGTQRLERWLLWPMGIASPGAMRQWGNHATAFVGRRHFDDPALFQGLIAP